MTMMLFPPKITGQNSFTSMDVTPQDYDAYDVLEERQSSSETRAPLSTTALSTLFGRRVIVGKASFEEEIIARYASINRVQRIYLFTSTKTIKVFMWLNQPHYDEALMDKLLDAEEAILERYPQRLCEFHYVPVLTGDRPPFIPSQAQLIWENVVHG